MGVITVSPEGFQSRYSDPWRYCCARCRACSRSASLSSAWTLGRQLPRVPFALFGGQTEPGVGFDPILGHARAGQVQHRQAALRRGEALQGGLTEQAGGPPKIPVRFQGVVAAQLELGGGVALGGGCPDPAQGGLIRQAECPCR